MCEILENLHKAGISTYILHRVQELSPSNLGLSNSKYHGSPHIICNLVLDWEKHWTQEGDDVDGRKCRKWLGNTSWEATAKVEMMVLTKGNDGEGYEEGQVQGNICKGRIIITFRLAKKTHTPDRW